MHKVQPGKFTDSSVVEAARQQSMQEDIATILEDFAGKIRGLGPIEGFSREGVLLHYWDCCIVKTVRSFTKHRVTPSKLISLLLGAAYEAPCGDAQEKDDAIMQMVLRGRLTGHETPP